MNNTNTQNKIITMSNWQAPIISLGANKEKALQILGLGGKR